MKNTVLEKHQLDGGNGKKAIDLESIKKQVTVNKTFYEKITIDIQGITPLRMQKISDATIQDIDNKRKKKIGEDNIKKDIQLSDKEVCDLKTWKNDKGEVCFVARGFLLGMGNVAKDRTDIIDGVSGKNVNGSIKFREPLIPIKYSKMVVSERVGKPQKNSAPMRYVQPEFQNWSCKLYIRFWTKTLSAEQIVNLLNYAVGYMGLGSLRPELGWDYGQYEVVGIKGGWD